ncbi:fibronectin type III domain-containing protein 10 [Pholidichthys leucotaenia]
MKTQQRPSLLALSALLFCTFHQTTRSDPGNPSLSSSAASPSEEGGGGQRWLRQSNISRESGPSADLKEVTGQGRSNKSAVLSENSVNLSPDETASPVCAYRVIEGGIGGQLCFRRTLFGYKCHEGECRTAVSLGNLVANILANGSVLLQWSKDDEAVGGQNFTAHPNTAFRGRRHRRGGYELSCWWNGSYTQFECAGVHLGPGCRDFLLAELHENIPYRICLRALSRADQAQGPQRRDCVEFTLPPSGMQDIVIAMTTVGGAICVMLVIICLLVAYITENIMSPAAQHAYSYRTRSRH